MASFRRKQTPSSSPPPRPGACAPEDLRRPTPEQEDPSEADEAEARKRRTRTATSAGRKAAAAGRAAKDAPPARPEAKQPRRAQERGPARKVIAFANQKGGVAKTTTDAQPRRRLRGVRPPRALRRHGPAGQPDDEPGHRPRQGREDDVRRARPPTSRSARSSASARSTSPSPRSTSPAPRSR